MLAMLMHSSCPRVCQAAASALSTLLQQNASFRKVLLAKGIHLNALELMRRHAGAPGVAASGCRLLGRLLEGSDASLDTVTAVVPKIIAVMRSHEAELPVQLEAAQAVLHVLAPGGREGRGGLALDEVREQCWRSGLHEPVLAALRRVGAAPAACRRPGAAAENPGALPPCARCSSLCPSGGSWGPFLPLAGLVLAVLRVRDSG
ncbi:PREDICTED: leucine-rich repeat serine/threonine-protein kinase 2-like [Condylura cristata]|uniref:leucine-rich repeat serine/threonine-protein kinase 2-like n=1 Tax=Condylura cristata TaxID=143302 RepID=UPI000643C260|nr:PREDICTED: leucine-rich repeat serine/threonine-protein kinase 2-like [Condylura cristata]